VKRAGQVAVMRFPSVDLRLGKPRPVLLLAPVPGAHEDWLVCMISSQLRHEAPGLDEVIRETDADFDGSGLKVVSLIRLGRLAVVSSGMLAGAIGSISAGRLVAVRHRLADWLRGEQVSRPPHAP